MKLEKWEFVGVIIVCLLGLGFYYAYDLSDSNQFVKLIAPTSNSIFEYLKMTFYAMFVFSLLEYIFIGKEHKNFIFAKTFGSILAAFLVAVIFYGYTNFLDQALYLDVLTLILAVVVGQLFSYIILKSKMFITGLNFLAMIAIFGAMIVIASYSEHPGTNQVFVDEIVLIEE